MTRKRLMGYQGRLHRYPLAVKEGLKTRLGFGEYPEWIRTGHSSEEELVADLDLWDKIYDRQWDAATRSFKRINAYAEEVSYERQDT